MTSTLTMTSGRSSSQRRLLGLTSCNKNNASHGYSGSPLLNSSDMDVDSAIKQDSRKSDADDNNRSASDYISKLLNSRDFSNDLEGSPSTLSNSEANGFAYEPMKSTSNSASTSRTSSVQKTSVSNQKRNRSSHLHKHNPAEVFRKDLISAMKLPDNSQLLQEEYWVMVDSWRIEWEKGVQVPVNQKAIPSRCVRDVSKETYGDFRMPRKMVKSSPEPGDKEMIDYNVLADSTCRYDLDELDVYWLKEVNFQRKLMGLKQLDEFSMEQIMEELEIQCHENLQLAIQTKEGLGIEYDENVVCDVCRSLDCEEGNEMVFCDGCNLCVHQACYGILKVPDGSWLCKLCALGIRGSTVCVLCNRKGGAMKSTRSGNKWAHVSCALWIPEITIADPDRMEPITKVSHVPASRWALVCSICKERVGACIQCSVKHCVTAYHVTCAIEAKLDMDADCGSSGSDDDDEPVIFKSFCKKHSTRRKGSDVEDDEETEEKKRSHRQRRIMELEEDFYTQVKPSAVASSLSVPCEITELVMVYWKLKRKANFNRPLITPKNEEDTALAEAAETNLQRRLRMFTHLRQDLERVRNLCYMIGRREKTKRASVKNMESVFLTQMKVLERRMCEESHYDSARMVPFLKKFGKAQVCDLARKESVILAKSKEWSPNAEDSDNNKTDSSVQALKKQSRTHKADFKTSPSEEKPKILTSAEKLESRQAADQLKNGLHRKAFASACQKREFLLRQGRRKTSHQGTSNNLTSKEHSGASLHRKRSHKSDVGSDLEDSTVDKTVKKKIRLEKSQSWTRWQASRKVPNKNEPEEDGSAAKPNRVGTRRTRRGSILSDTSASNKDAIDNGAVQIKTMHNESAVPLLTRTESHLIVKWDSDKNNDDTPDITEKSTVGKDRKLSLTEDKIVTRSKTEIDESSGSELSVPLRRSSRTSLHEEKYPKEEQRKKAVSSRTSRFSSKEKTESKSLVSSLNTGTPRDLKKTSESRKQDEPLSLFNPDDKCWSGGESSKDFSHSSTLVQSPKEEEDRGYRGDMDESDSDAPSPSRHKTSLPRQKRSLHKEIRLTKSTDTSESCYGNEKSRLSSRKRRLKNRSRAILERKQSLVSFQGFKGLEDESSEPKEKSLKNTSRLNEIEAEKSWKSEETEIRKSPISLLEPCEIETKQLPDADQTSDEKPSRNFSKPDETVKILLSESLDSQEVTDKVVTDSDLAAADLLVESPKHPADEAERTLLDVENEVNDTSEVCFTLNGNTSTDIAPEAYSSMENYQAAYYNPHMYSHMAIQQTFYYQQYYQYWQQPPPPPPPPPPEDDPPEDDIQEVIRLSQDSGGSVMPDNQLNPALPAQCNQHFDNLSLQQVQYFPTFSEQYPIASEVQTQPDISSLGDANDARTKKKKKKSKKKKKKKKRKRKHSKMQSDSENELCSSASSGSDEWGIEYCSTLVDNEPVEQADILTPDVLPVETSQPCTSTISNKLDFQSSPTSMELEAQTVDKRDSKLLIKIDKSKLSSSPLEGPSESESSNEDALSSEGAKPSRRPLITPLKLKLCGQKSDRTLRGGLVAREYEILEPSVSENSFQPLNEAPDFSPKSQPANQLNTPQTVEKNISTTPSNNKPKTTKATGKTAKKTNQKKTNTSKKQATSKVPTQTTEISSSTASVPTSKAADQAPGPPSAVQAKPSQTSAIPERHWKKRKLHVHEASVTTNAISGDKTLKKTNTATASSSSTIPALSNTNHSLKPSGSLSPGINHASLIQNDGASQNSPGKTGSKPIQPRRKKTLENTKTSEKHSKFSSSLSSVSPYKFTVSKAHQKKMASTGSAETPDENRDVVSQSDPVKSENDPYAFADFSEM